MWDELRTPTSTTEMRSPHFVPTVIAPHKTKSAEVLKHVFLRGAEFGRRHFRGDDIDRGLLCEVLPARLPRPLEELRRAERACRDLQHIWLPHADNPGLHLIVQGGIGSRPIVLRQSGFVEGLTGLLPFNGGDRHICSFHATEILLSKLSKLLVAEVEHGGLLQEEVAMCLEIINLPFQSLALLG